MRLVTDPGHQVADVVHEPRRRQLVVIGDVMLEERGGLQRMVQLRDGRAETKRPGATSGQQIDDLVDTQAGRVLAHGTILPHVPVPPPLRVR